MIKTILYIKSNRQTKLVFFEKLILLRFIKNTRNKFGQGLEVLFMAYGNYIKKCWLWSLLVVIISVLVIELFDGFWLKLFIQVCIIVAGQYLIFRIYMHFENKRIVDEIKKRNEVSR